MVAGVFLLPRALVAGLIGLCLLWWAGGQGAWGQAPPGERSAPRVTLKPGGAGGTAGDPGDPAAGELLPALPPEPTPPARVPRKVVVAGVMPLPPDVPPLGLPSDGELAPSFPDLPDLPGSSLLPQTPADDLGPGGRAAGIPFPGDDGGDGGGGVADPGVPATDAVVPGGGAGVIPPGLVPPPPAPDLPFPVWHESPKKARTLAEVEQRCLLLVFSSAQGEAGGTSRQMSDEVFATPEFNEFALGHLVLCGLFYARSTSALDLNDSSKMARLDALAAIRKAFKVRGFPTLILFGPDGREINRWSGFVTGRGTWLQQQIRQAVEGHEAVIFETERRRSELATRGYRTWTSVQGSPFFARLIRFDAETAVLRDESGAERTVRLKQLTLPDRELITRQRLGRPMPERAPAAGGAETTLR
jgi:hypothetical protein